MPLANFQGTLQDQEGNVIPVGQVQVQREAAGFPLASIFQDEDGLVPQDNPFNVTNGKFEFFARGYLPGYRVRGFVPGFPALERIYRHVRIGTAGGVDTDQLGIGADVDRQVADLAARAAFDAEDEGFRVLVSDIGDGRAGIYERNTSTPGVWVGPAMVTGADGPAGTGLSPDATVDELTDRDAFDAEAEGFVVQVNDIGDGRAALYTRDSPTPGEWSDPAYITSSVTVGTVTTVGSEEPADVIPSGSPFQLVLNFEIPKGKSAYQVALDEGFVGTEEEWLNSLKGVTAGLRYLFDTATADADPGPGLLRLNHATPGSATLLFIDNTDFDGADVSGFIDTWDDPQSVIKGRLTIRSAAVPATYIMFSVLGTVVDGTGYRKVTIEDLAGSGTFADNEPVGVEFARTGDSISGITMGQAIVATLIFGV